LENITKYGIFLRRKNKSMWFVKFVNNDDELVIVEVMLENMSTKGV